MSSRRGGARWLSVVGVSVVSVVLAVMVVPRVLGGAALIVLTGSMTPTYPVGSIVVVLPTDPHSIGPGDVITFQAAPGVAEFITHRVVRVQPDTDPYSFITKGDANPAEDADPVPIGAVRGTVRYHIPFVGRISQLVRSPLGFLLIAAGPAAWFIRRQARAIRDELNGTAPVVADDDATALADAPDAPEPAPTGTWTIPATGVVRAAAAAGPSGQVPWRRTAATWSTVPPPPALRAAAQWTHEPAASTAASTGHVASGDGTRTSVSA